MSTLICENPIHTGQKFERPETLFSKQYYFEDEESDFEYKLAIRTRAKISNNLEYPILDSALRRFLTIVFCVQKVEKRGISQLFLTRNEAKEIDIPMLPIFLFLKKEEFFWTSNQFLHTKKCLINVNLQHDEVLLEGWKNSSWDKSFTPEGRQSRRPYVIPIDSFSISFGEGFFYLND